MEFALRANARAGALRGLRAERGTLASTVSRAPNLLARYRMEFANSPLKLWPWLRRRGNGAGLEGCTEPGFRLPNKPLRPRARNTYIPHAALGTHARGIFYFRSLYIAGFRARVSSPRRDKSGRKLRADES